MVFYTVTLQLPRKPLSLLCYLVTKWKILVIVCQPGALWGGGVLTSSQLVVSWNSFENFELSYGALRIKRDKNIFSFFSPIYLQDKIHEYPTWVGKQGFTWYWMLKYWNYFISSFNFYYTNRIYYVWQVEITMKDKK